MTMQFLQRTMWNKSLSEINTSHTAVGILLNISRGSGVLIVPGGLRGRVKRGHGKEEP